MVTGQRALKGAAVLLVAIAVVAAGCASRQAKQQGTAQMQQNQYQAKSNTDQRVQIANQAAQKITQINGIKHANVLVTGNNAYVAATAATSANQLSKDLENQIAQQVRATDPNIRNVYVSTNPEFVKRVNTYVADVSQGRPVAGFFQEFSEMVQRIFPTAR